MSDKEARAKALDRIKKCLALGTSSNANEAATALRQAQKLMAQHGIDEAEVNGIGIGNDSVDVPIQATKKSAPIQLIILCQLMGKAFGVKHVIEHRMGVSDLSYRIRYFGPDTRVPLACFAHTVCFRAMEKEWREHLAIHPELKGVRAARASFQVGWLKEVSAKVIAIGFPEEEATELALRSHYKFLTVAPKKKMGLYDSIKQQGAAAAKDFSLHRPMDGVQQKTLTR